MHSANRQPVPILEHALSAEDLLSRSRAAEATCVQALQGIVALGDSERTFANTVEALEQSLMDYLDVVQRLSVLMYVHPEASVRLAAAQVEEDTGKFLVQVMSRRDLYRAVKAYQANRGREEALCPDEARLLDVTAREFRRNGLDLDDASLARLIAIRTELTEVSTRFQLNLNDNHSRIVVDASELKGLPPSYVERLSRTPDGKYIVTCQYPDYFPFMQNAVDAGARRRLYVAFQSREAEKNLPLLKRALALRQEQAALLGYANHADYVLEDRMAKSAAAVKVFLGDLQSRLKEKRNSDYARMAELKRSETGAAAAIEPWDVAYYLNQLKKRDWSIDAEAIRAYFPIEKVLSGLFEVYEQLLGVRIAKVEGTQTWAKEASLYEIRDAATGGHVGFFYLDLFPREGKYGHAAAAGVTVARQVGETYRAPISVMFANFNPPSADRPALLSHDEVETLFHEFGHIMHQTLTAARYGSLSGTAVDRDFVEAPSQMLENWVYEKEVLDRMSGHYQDPDKKLPEETIQKLKAARNFDAGYHYTRQVFLATFDQALHTSKGEADPDALDRELFSAILGMAPVEGTHFSATFGHLMGGYDAGYYGYLWSEVFADDMFTEFKKQGILNSELGKKYRSIVLESGRMRDADALLRAFLGRAPSQAAFFEKLGLSAESP